MSTGSRSSPPRHPRWRVPWWLWLLLGALAMAVGQRLLRALPPSPASTPVTAAVAAAPMAAAAGPADTAAFADARRGFVAAPTGQVRNQRGEVVWDFDAFAFVAGDAPATVHPGLWRQARLNNHAGLFKVTDGIWQLRGFDLSNLTLIEGRTGWIVVDALTSRETAAAAMAFARRHLGERPVSAVIFTHSHIDHFGGALGVIGADEARARRVPVVAPAAFVAEATHENVLMGVAMGRRAAYMYGSRLPRDATGLVDNGLGKAVALGEVGLLEPTLLIAQPTQELVLDGVRFVFHDASGTEAPAELVFSVPERKAFCSADTMAHTLHNLYTLRGAPVRDALQWAASLDAALTQAAGAEVLFHQHTWPVWGADRIRDFIEKQRDVYKYLHDQTVRLMNAGLTAGEIAETLSLPKALDEHSSVRGYYGTVRHNVRGVVQAYLGWYDAHPANLDPHPPVEAGRRYVELAGGADQAVAAARRAYDAGDFRWSAELLKHVVFAEPGHAAAREWLARSFEQMGWRAESAPWRNVYLSGALELREGPPARGLNRESVLPMLEHTPVDRFLEAMAASVDGPRAADLVLTINLSFTDLGETYVLKLANGVLHHRKAPPDAAAQATLKLTRPFFLQMMVGKAGAAQLLLSDQTRIEGSAVDLARFFAVLDKAPGTFAIVTR